MSTKSQHEQDLERIKNFCLMDDDFMKSVFDGDIGLTQFVLRIIMSKDDLLVNFVKTEYGVHNLGGHSVRLDVFATDSTGRLYDIEIQKADKGAGSRRARFNSGLIDGYEFKKGKSYDSLPETYVIFITENDVLRGNLPIYHIERIITENNELFNDGEHIIYVNGQNSDLTTELGKLIHDFHESDPNQMLNPALAEKTRYFKETEEGVSTMSKAMEEMREQAKFDGIREFSIKQIMRLINRGWSTDRIAEELGYEKPFILSVQEELLRAVK